MGHDAEHNSQVAEEHKHRLVIGMLCHAFLGGAVIYHVGAGGFRVRGAVSKSFADIAVL